MRILITGASGFIGSHLVSIATARGLEVVALSRSGGVPGPGVQMFSWSFGQSLPESVSRKLDCVVHLAHDFAGEEGARRTIESTLAVARQLHRAGVRRQLFFSSFSAGEHAASLYGRTKFAIEQGFTEMLEAVIVRPGLVLGDGGIYGRIRRWARTLPVIPLPDGGRGEVAVIEVAKLCRETLNLAFASTTPREANLFEREPRSLRHLVLEAAQEVGRTPWILPVPTALLMAGLKAVEFLRLPLPVNADNLAGFTANQAARYVSTLED